MTYATFRAWLFDHLDDDGDVGYAARAIHADLCAVTAAGIPRESYRTLKVHWKRDHRASPGIIARLRAANEAYLAEHSTRRRGTDGND